MASTLQGVYYSPLGTPQVNVAAVTDQDGDLGGYGLSETSLPGPGLAGGSYSFSLPTPLPGVTKNYEIYFGEQDQWYRQFEFGAQVTSTSSGGPVTTARNHQFIYPDCITGYMARQEVPIYYQSFKATGKWVSSIGYFQYKQYGPMTTFSILQGGPSGSQIGPSRTITTQITDPSTVYWNAGEVPLTPGQIYCVKIEADWQGVLCGVYGVQSEACRPMVPGAAILNGNAYPDGQTWCTDASGLGLYLVAGPACLVINQDTDGVTTTVNTRKTKDPAPYSLSYTSCVIAGQTFTAKGTSLLSFSCLVGSIGTQSYYVACYTAPGTKGMGGTRIGPRKFMQPIDYNFRSACVWKPGEVPLTPGQQYYVCLQTSQNSPFVIYTDSITSEKYMGGSAYIYSDTRGTGGVQTYDLSTTICEESYAGSTSTPNDAISNVVIDRGSSTTTISWQTAAVNNSSTYVDYGPSTPYSSTVLDSTPNSTTHSVTLTGLTPNTLYHARISSVPAVLPPAVGCYTTGTTRDFVFVTNSAYYPFDNLVTNPDFEDVTQGAYDIPVGWTWGFEHGNSFEILNSADLPPSGWFDGIRPHKGNNCVSGAINGSSAEKVYLYQKVNTVPGKLICARGWLATYQQDQLGVLQANTCRGRIGIDPTGGTSISSSNVVWCQDVVAQNLFAPMGQWNNVAPAHQWTEVWDSTGATGPSATIFLEAGADANMAWTIWAWDDVYATQKDAPPHFTNPGAAKMCPDGTLLCVDGGSNSPLIVTLTPSTSGDGSWYVEDAKRSSAIRVVSTDQPAMGDTVTLQGTVQTKPSGERYLAANTALTSDTHPSQSLDPLYVLQPFAANMKQWSLGKVGKPVNQSTLYAGADTTGMLMRLTGRVFSMGDPGFVWATDGSVDTNPKMVLTDPVTHSPISPGVIKVVTTNLSPSLLDGHAYEMTGILMLSGTTPDTAVPVLVLRGNEDAIDLGP